jgi:TonB-linked SusC/RagA family outer membrane protein
MKARSWILMCVGTLTLAAGATAQVTTVALEPTHDRTGSALLDRPADLFVRDVTLATALTRLTEASGVPVAFSPSIVGAETRPVECDCREHTVGEALGELLGPGPFAFRELRGEILVYLAKPSPEPAIFREHRTTFRTSSYASVLPINLMAAPLNRRQQTGIIQGVAVEATTRRPLQGVQVTVSGTRLGAVSGDNGTFQIRDVPAGEHVVRAVLIGYEADDQRVTVAQDETVSITITLRQSAIVLEQLVVTALGIERQERSLTTSVQQVRADDLTRVPDINLVAALSGKASGVSIFNSNTPGGSSRIVIRGASSLTGNNQPLFIIDGVPVSNAVGSGVFGSRGYAAIDYGNAIQDINPNDIESISILKGPNASALYGSRAANGAVLITTKSGRTAREGTMQVTASSTLTFERPLRLPDYQNLYGQGYNGRFAYADGRGNGTYDDYDESWGPRLDIGLMVPQFFSNGQPAPWVSSPDNVRNFFETGVTTNTSASFAASTQNASFRLSVANLQQDGMLPGFKLDRTTVGLNAAGGLTDRLRAQGSVQYFNIDGENRPAQGYSADNVMFGFVWFGRQVDTRMLRDRLYNPDGTQYNWNSIWNNNPYWVSTVNRNWDARDRLVGSVSLTYELTPWLSVLGRTGTDYYQDHRKRIFAAGTWGQAGVDANGAFGEGNVFRQETNTDFLFTATPPKVGDLSFTANVGGNRRDGNYRENGASVRDLVIPGLYDLGNAAVTPDLSDWREQTRTNSLYAAGQVGYRDYLYVDVTGRNDWSSTLPPENNSYFYPSVSGALIFTELFKVPGVSYGKLRTGWAAVGNDADPFQLVDPYIADPTFDGVPRFYASSRLRNFDLKPERTNAWEIGGELRFLEDRFGIDATYYHKRTSNQIVPVQISALTGFTTRMVNAGTIRNSGVELLAHVTPVRLANGLEWEVTGSFSKNNSKVEELYGDLQQIVLDEYYGVQVVARVGEPYGQMYGRLYDRDPDGNIVVGANGLPLNTTTNPFGVLGNYNPDWTAGIGNRLRYGPLTVNALVDIRSGGSIYSLTSVYGYRSGVLSETLTGRMYHDANGVPYDTINGNGIVVDGVRRIVSGTDTTYVPYPRRVTAQAYWKGLAGIREPFVFDASFVKLREVRLGWDVPRSIIGRLGLDRAEVAIMGRNLFLWSDVPHIDPETALNSGNAQGYEYGQTPSARSVGFSLTVTPRSGGRPAALSAGRVSPPEPVNEQ